MWENLPYEVLKEFATLRTSPPVCLLGEHSSYLYGDRRALLGAECKAARSRIGEEWWQRLKIDNARKRAKYMQNQCRKPATIGRPPGGSLSTPRLIEKREKDRARRECRSRIMREKLPDLREGVTWNFTIHTRDKQVVEGHLTTGLYADGRVGEVFVKMDKEGGTGAWIDMWAISVSMLLQSGLTLDTVCKKFVGMRFDPCGATESKDVPHCSSVVDLVARYLLFRYGKEKL